MKETMIVKIKKNIIPSFSVEAGQTVVWENGDTVAHQLNSNTEDPDFFFDVGILFPGESSSPVLFDTRSASEGLTYGCGLVPGLKGIIHVGTEMSTGNTGVGHIHDHPKDDHNHSGGHDNLKHFHGFVTGGKSGDKIYMTHTPIFSDERHHFQIILRASFLEEKHLQEYNRLRNSTYGAGKIQLFFDHVALINIQSGVLQELEADSLRYYPDVPTIRPGLQMPLVSTVLPEFAGAKIKIDKILHFRVFTPDMPYPDALTYLMYGDDKDVFIDHFISRAPNFHSVAKLKQIPSFWNKDYYDIAIPVQVPLMKIKDASPKTIKRVAFLDNQFHLIWGLPSGTLLPVDPLIKISQKGEFAMISEKGEKANIQISNFLHFDATRLLNDGLGF